MGAASALFSHFVQLPGTCHENVNNIVRNAQYLREYYQRYSQSCSFGDIRCGPFRPHPLCAGSRLSFRRRPYCPKGTTRIRETFPTTFHPVNLTGLYADFKPVDVSVLRNLLTSMGNGGRGITLGLTLTAFAILTRKSFMLSGYSYSKACN